MLASGSGGELAACAKRVTVTMSKESRGPPFANLSSLEARAQLPLVDPDFLIIERRADELHAYARGLLQHLREIRAGGTPNGYPIATIKSATVWLIESYAEAGVAPLPEAAQLIDEIVQPCTGTSTLPVRRSSEKAYWAAIEFEAGRSPDPTNRQPSTATLYAVAKHVRTPVRNRYASQKAAEATVRGWRRLPHYRANVALQRSLE